MVLNDMIDCFLDYSYTRTGETKERKLKVCVRGMEINVKEMSVGRSREDLSNKSPAARVYRKKLRGMG